MRAVMVMYDSMNKAFLEPYGNDWVQTPNFSRLAAHAVTFDSFYAGSLPCMPARRELHTGRYNFLHRGWSPLEPFDDSMPQILKQHGIYSHMVTDHCHYWEDGGSTYHNRFASYEFVRGQEGDTWDGSAAGYQPNQDGRVQDAKNRTRMIREQDHYHARCCEQGLHFLEQNKNEDNWYLQLEYYDPHEPFFAPERFKKLYTDVPDDLDWPKYAPLSENDPEYLKHSILNYAALVSMCDEYLGKVLDMFDKHDLWKDTMLIVNTDHGYLLGEHGYVGKNYMPVYNEIANIPLFVWDPRNQDAGTRRQALAQTIDLPATILELFGQEKPQHMMGRDLQPVLKSDETIHDAILYGYHGMHININDGKHTYMKAASDAENKPLYQYTLMPMHIKKMISKEELLQADRTLYDKFEFNDHVPVLRIPVDERYDRKKYYKYSEHAKYGSLLFDIEKDPLQLHPLEDPSVTDGLLKKMVKLMKDSDAPDEQYERMGLQEYLETENN